MTWFVGQRTPISPPSLRWNASPHGVLGRTRTLRVRVLPASLRRSRFAGDGGDLVAR